MAIEKLSQPSIEVINVTNLNAVTSATEGDAVEMRKFVNKTVFVKVSANTGAVTVGVEISHDGTSWSEIQDGELPKTYTASNTSDEDSFSFYDYSPYIRVKTTTQSSSTVTAKITGQVS